MTVKEHLEQLKEILSIKEYHENGFKGKGIVVASVESTSSDHGSKVKDTVLTYSPEATFISFNDENPDISATGDANTNDSIYFDDFVDWCIKNKVDIVTSSLGWKCDKDIEKQAIKKLYDNGIIFCNSAGNEGIEILYTNTDKPYSFNGECITVSGYMHSTNGKFSWSGFNYGEPIDVVGCGSSCPTLLSSGKCYSWSGTSAATPMIAGMLATYKSANKNFNSKNAFNLINNNYIPLIYKDREYKILVLPPIELVDTTGKEVSMENDKYCNPSDWAYESWKKATDKNITDGTNPQGNLTREQLIVILDRLNLI